MEKRRLDKLGIETSLLGFGCMRFPTLEDGKIDEILAEKMLDQAMAQGVTYLRYRISLSQWGQRAFRGRQRTNMTVLLIILQRNCRYGWWRQERMRRRF